MSKLICFFLGVGLFVLSAVTDLLASPNDTMLTGTSSQGSWKFAKELQRLWTEPRFNMDHSLYVETVENPKERLERLLFRQADFAILDGKSAWELLPQYPQLAVISVLWSNSLQVFGESNVLLNQDTTVLQVHASSLFFVNFWNAHVIDKTQSLPYLFLLPMINADRIELSANELFSIHAPYPLQEVENRIQSNSNFQLLTFPNSLLNRIKSKSPWLLPTSIPRETYSNQRGKIATVSSHPVLVLRADQPQKLVASILTILFSQKGVVASHPLFQRIKKSNNTPYLEKYNYHIESLYQMNPSAYPRPENAK